MASSWRVVFTCVLASNCAIPLDLDTPNDGGATDASAVDAGRDGGSSRVEDGALTPPTPTAFVSIDLSPVISSGDAGTIAGWSASIAGSFDRQFGCEPTRFGECELRRCFSTERSSPPPTAGPLRFEWPDGGMTVTPAMPQVPSGVPYEGALGLVAPESLLRVEGAGAQAPAFSASIVLPSSEGFSVPRDVSRASELRLALPSPRVGRPHLVMTGTTEQWAVSCIFTTPNEGVVPAQLLAQLPVGVMNISTGAATASREAEGAPWLLSRTYNRAYSILMP